MLAVKNIGKTDLERCLIEMIEFSGTLPPNIVLPLTLRTANQIRGDERGRFLLSAGQEAIIPLAFHRPQRANEWFLVDGSGTKHFFSADSTKMIVRIYQVRPAARAARGRAPAATHGLVLSQQHPDRPRTALQKTMGRLEIVCQTRSAHVVSMGEAFRKNASRPVNRGRTSWFVSEHAFVGPQLAVYSRSSIGQLADTANRALRPAQSANPTATKVWVAATAVTPVAMLGPARICTVCRAALSATIRAFSASLQLRRRCLPSKTEIPETLL
ncbi:hypothetical protein H8A95_30090 [Bradyrhizobium sp. Pear76]|uniref:hypothetical protein n=1 Tax=Bradyrhizobium TaxID=374 RepID=UPI001E329ABC|nr:MULTISPECIES: hypothetical protein [Bradyrhizobium]MCC8966461.1 hypothetical protein [Bradyrhizobium oropedii]